VKRLTGINQTDRSRIFRSIHFWAIVIISLGLTFIYYSDILFSELVSQRWSWLWHLVIFEFNNDIHGSLFFIPFVYAALIYWWRGILLTWLFTMAIMLPRIYYYAPDINSLITNVFLLLVPLLIVAILTLQIKWRESEKKATLEREKERQAYMARIFISQEEERKRISREIHDDTTQRLWIVANDARKLAVDKNHNIDQHAREELETIKDTVLNIAEDTKRLSLALRPGILDDLGLVPAIRWLVDQLNRDDSVQAKVSVEGHQRSLNQEVNNHLFRIVQEALNNTRRHAKANEVNVKLIYSNESVKLLIQDNGIGFLFKDIDSYPHQERIGLIGMQERARLLNSDLQVFSEPGKGTTISVEFQE
jgi:two-component system sensor histidine kinase DegS